MSYQHRYIYIYSMSCPSSKFKAKIIIFNMLDLIRNVNTIDFPPLLSRLSLVHGKDYGKPVAGSASEKRSQEYQRNVVEEVASLCYQISLHGYK